MKREIKAEIKIKEIKEKLKMTKGEIQKQLVTNLAHLVKLKT